MDIFVNNLLIDTINSTKLIEKYDQYNEVLKETPEITDEELLFIQQIVSENIEKDIELKRDEESGKNFKLLLGGKDFLEVDRKDLHLSNGEQNFISLAFELLKARKIENEVVILDDPISSFDSIYKNKIAFCIIKFLEGKRQLILTHNTDLIRLLEYQLKGCFNLYLFNNMEQGNNGFIKVKKEEEIILLDINKLLDLLRNKVFDAIENEQNFLMSMIPFMRGYANLLGDSDTYKKLSKVMHGYEDEKINITEIYNDLFCKSETSKITNEYVISALDIINIDKELDDLVILEDTEYPLLNRTLFHSLNYLYLRLKVEQTLVQKYHIDTSENLLLQQIIQRAFIHIESDNADDKARKNKNRIFLTSRKTLLNEFNHFEGNMNIFQPAIDISDSALKKEKESILSFLQVV